MAFYICKNVATQLRLLTASHKFLRFKCHHFTSSALDNHTNQESITLSYLINSCGLSSKNALKASKSVKFSSPENADSVIAFFKKHGFTDTHISNIVRKFPRILLRNCEDSILPKLEYFTSIGFSSADLTDFVVDSPRILERSLVKTIIPTCTLLRNLLKNHTRTIRATRRFFKGWICDIEVHVIPNINILKEYGVNESTMVFLLVNYPSVLKRDTDRFKVTVEKVKQLGFNPHTPQFVVALQVLCSMSESTWDKKVKILKKWGWSEDDLNVSFGKAPWCMVVSEDKLSSILNVVINKSGFEPSDVVQSPGILLHSLEKRVVPRCLFYQVLLKRGLIKKKWSLWVLLGSSDTQFMKKITMCYKDAAPELLKLYQEKLST